MKTIFITIFEGVEVKNILRTGIMQNLLDQNIRIVLFTKSQTKVDYYSKEFNNPNVIFEVVEWHSQSRVDHLFSRLKFTLLRTKTTDLKREMIAGLEGTYLHYYVGRFFNFLIAWPLIRKIVRFFDFLLVKDTTYSLYFEKYNPDLVFMAHLFDEIEIHLLHEAKRRKIPTVGLINSWDKVTSRCILRLLPDTAIVFNEIVKNELVTLNEMNPEDIYVSGLPQYDIFYNRAPSSRDDFFKKIGISPEKRLIVYAPIGRAFSSSDWDIIDFLSDTIPEGTDLLVRFQPNDFVDEEELQKRSYLKYDKPGIRFGSKRGIDWDMNTNELEHLQNTLHHMSLLVCYASSISIDAAIFDKPIINIDFEINPSPFMIKSPTQYYRSLHYMKALESGGIGLVKSKEELTNQIEKYLQNPELDTEGRKKLVKEQTSFVDGRSAERISKIILENLKR